MAATSSVLVSLIACETVSSAWCFSSVCRECSCCIHDVMCTALMSPSARKRCSCSSCLAIASSCRRCVYRSRSPCCRKASTRLRCRASARCSRCTRTSSAALSCCSRSSRSLSAFFSSSDSLRRCSDSARNSRRRASCSINSVCAWSRAVVIVCAMSLMPRECICCTHCA